MFELGVDSELEHQKIVDLLEQLQFENCYLIGNLFMKTKSHFTKLAGIEELNAILKTQALTNHTFLIKGSRGMALERIVPLIP